MLSLTSVSTGARQSCHLRMQPFQISSGRHHQTKPNPSPFGKISQGRNNRTSLFGRLLFSLKLVISFWPMPMPMPMQCRLSSRVSERNSEFSTDCCRRLLPKDGDNSIKRRNQSDEKKLCSPSSTWGPFSLKNI